MCTGMEALMLAGTAASAATSFMSAQSQSDAADRQIAAQKEAADKAAAQANAQQLPATSVDPAMQAGRTGKSSLRIDLGGIGGDSGGKEITGLNIPN